MAGYLGSLRNVFTALSPFGRREAAVLPVQPVGEQPAVAPVEPAAAQPVAVPNPAAGTGLIPVAAAPIVSATTAPVVDVQVVAAPAPVTVVSAVAPPAPVVPQARTIAEPHTSTSNAVQGEEKADTDDVGSDDATTVIAASVLSSSDSAEPPRVSDARRALFASPTAPSPQARGPLRMHIDDQVSYFVTGAAARRLDPSSSAPAGPDGFPRASTSFQTTDDNTTVLAAPSAPLLLTESVSSKAPMLSLLDISETGARRFLEDYHAYKRKTTVSNPLSVYGCLAAGEESMVPIFVRSSLASLGKSALDSKFADLCARAGVQTLEQLCQIDLHAHMLLLESLNLICQQRRDYETATAAELAARVFPKFSWKTESGTFNRQLQNFQNSWYFYVRLDSQACDYFSSHAGCKDAVARLVVMLPHRVASFVRQSPLFKTLSTPDRLFDFLCANQVLLQGMSLAATMSTSGASSTPDARGLRCHKCNELGHLAKHCKAKPSKSDSGATASYASLTCHGCGEVGHIRPNCPNAAASGAPRGASRRRQGRKPGASTTDAVTNTVTYTDEQNAALDTLFAMSLHDVNIVIRQTEYKSPDEQLALGLSPLKPIELRLVGDAAAAYSTMSFKTSFDTGSDISIVSSAVADQIIANSNAKIFELDAGFSVRVANSVDVSIRRALRVDLLLTDVRDRSCQAHWFSELLFVLDNRAEQMVLLGAQSLHKRGFRRPDMVHRILSATDKSTLFERVELVPDQLATRSSERAQVASVVIQPPRAAQPEALPVTRDHYSSDAYYNLSDVVNTVARSEPIVFKFSDVTDSVSSHVRPAPAVPVVSEVVLHTDSDIPTSTATTQDLINSLPVVNSVSFTAPELPGQPFVDADDGNGHLPEPALPDNRAEVISVLEQRVEMADLKPAAKARLSKALFGAEQLHRVFVLRLSNDTGLMDVKPVTQRVIDAVNTATFPAYGGIKPGLMDIAYDYYQSLVDAGFGCWIDGPVRFASPVIGVRKAHSKPTDPVSEQVRWVVDYKRVNTFLEREEQIIPTIADFVAFAAGSELFAAFDVNNCFHRIPLHSDCQIYFVHRVGGRLYRPFCIGMGMTNSATQCQRVMDSEVLAGLPATKAYVDDLMTKAAPITKVQSDGTSIVLREADDVLVDNIVMLLQRLLKLRARLGAKKANFGSRNIQFLGRSFSKGGVNVSPEFIRLILACGTPRTLADLSSVIGAFSFISANIPRFHMMLYPLQQLKTDLLLTVPAPRSNAQSSRVALGSSWTAQHASSLSDLRRAAEHAVATCPHDIPKDMLVVAATDACYNAWCGLMTFCSRAEFAKPITQQRHSAVMFFGGCWNSQQRRQSILELETTALYTTLLRAQHLIIGRKCHVYVDHKNLLWLVCKDLSYYSLTGPASQKLARMCIYMRTLDLQLIYVPTYEHFFPDYMSRVGALPDSDADACVPSPIQVQAVTRSASAALVTAAVGAPVPDTHASATGSARPSSRLPAKALPAVTAADDLTEIQLSDLPSWAEIHRAQQDSVDASLVAALSLEPHVCTPGVACFHSDVSVAAAGAFSATADSPLFHRDGRVFVPSASRLRLRILWFVHIAYGAHCSIDQVVNTISKWFFWPRLRSDAADVRALCCVCNKSTGPLFVKRPIGTYQQPLQCNHSLCMDFFYVKEAAVSGGLQYILILKDRFSRFVRLHVSPMASSDAVVDALVSWAADFGLPSELMSDQGSHFISAVIADVRTRLGIGAAFTPVYAPFSNGAAENVCRRVREVLSSLSLHFGVDFDDWPALVPLVQLVINQTQSAVLAGHTPLEVFTGLQQRRSLDVAFLCSPSRNLQVQPHGVRLLSERLRDLPPSVSAALSEMAESVRVMRDSVVAHNAKVASKRLAHPDGALPIIAVGDLVFYSLRPAGGPKNAALSIWFGPALVMEVLNLFRYRIMDCGNSEQYELHARFVKEFLSARELPPKLHEGWLRLAARGGRGSLVFKILSHTLPQASAGDDASLATLEVQWDSATGVITPAEPFANFVRDVPGLLRRYIHTVTSARDKARLLAAMSLLQRQ